MAGYGAIKVLGLIWDKIRHHRAIPGNPDDIAALERKQAAKRNRKLGQWGENAAKYYLQKKGYKHICSNYRCKHGEIDLIMRHRNCIVFVEVKTRRNEDFVRTELVVNSRKRKHIAATAKDYIRRYRLYRFPCRFDVVVIIKPDKGRATVRHHEHAFKMPKLRAYRK